MLRATTACTFSTSHLPKVVRTPGVFCTFWLRNVLRDTTACTFSTSHLPKVVRCAFWLRNVLRDTTACTLSTSQLPKVVRTWCALYILMGPQVYFLIKWGPLQYGFFPKFISQLYHPIIFWLLQAKEKVTPKSCLRGFPHCHRCFQKSRLSHA